MASNAAGALGSGLGYRPEMRTQILAHGDRIDWLEVITDEYLPITRRSRAEAAVLAAGFPCVPHGVELSLGSPGDVDGEYVAQVAELVSILNAPWFSDHLCFTRAAGMRLGHLTPMPWTVRTAEMIAAKARLVQRAVGRPLLLENITYGFALGGELTEAQFIELVLEKADCWLLLDVTNVYTNSVNHGFDPHEFLDQVPLDRVVQIHLAGGQMMDGVLEDSHDRPVPEPVWELLEHVASRTTIRAVNVERDASFPSDFDELLSEVARARQVLELSAALRGPR
jgi:uncharacterized protein